MTLSRWFAVSAIALAAACNNSSTGYGYNPPPPPPPPAGGHSMTITVSNNQFSPTPDTIPAGSVLFQWSASAGTHNVTWQSGPSSPTGSGNKSANESYSTTLIAGTYTYHCTIHPSTMTGMIVVTP
jgi:plastocyanin